jgi:hypothetical protein
MEYRETRTGDALNKPPKQMGIVKQEQERQSKQSTYKSPGRCIDPIVAGCRRSSQVVGARMHGRNGQSVAIGKHMEASTHTYRKGNKTNIQTAGYRKGERGISCCLEIDMSHGN